MASVTLRRVVAGVLAAAYLVALVRPASASTHRVGDAGQPWRLHPVSYLFDAGELHRPEHIFGGAYSVEIVVDDDGDGLIDEDPVDLVDDDGDFLYNEDPVDYFDNDEDGAVDEDPVDGVDNDGDGLVDEDAVDFIDNDRDGLINEDGADPQIDNDGDGFLNEDGMRTGGAIYDPALRGFYVEAPFHRYEDAEAAAADPQGAGWGWGDDDRDSSCNEDDLNGVDDDGDGLVDEDPPGPPVSLPASWRVSAFSYEADGLTEGERRSLAFVWDPERSEYLAEGPQGESITASAAQHRFVPSDWVRPIQMGSRRNMVTFTEDRFLSGVFGTIDPIDSQAWGANLTGTSHHGTAGHGQVADGNMFTARATSQRSSSSRFRVHFVGLLNIDLIRMLPRPDFPDRTPTSFDIRYAGDEDHHFRTRLSSTGELNTRMIVSDFIIPRQTDQLRPPIKEYRFEEGGEYGPPRNVRLLNFYSLMPEGQTWELAEFEAYGRGYALDATYTTEIIDVGPARPRYRRYFDPEAPERPVPFESMKTTDADRDGSVEPEETSSVMAASQFDPELNGSPVTWGRLRWHGRSDGTGGDVQVRVRSGTSLDTRVYLRKVGAGVVSPFVARSLVEDWPTPGDRIDAHIYAQLTGLERPAVTDLPHNNVGAGDGLTGGWTPWSAPFLFEEGMVDRDGGGGVPLPLPPLHRYIQLRFDFVSPSDGGISLDYVEFDYSEPVVTRGILAEVFPDTTASMGVPSAFQYVLKPDMASGDVGFNRIDIAVPSMEARVDSILVDDLLWERMGATPAEELGGRAWLDTLTGVEGNRFASVTYFDSTQGKILLAIKTRSLSAADFPRGQDKEIHIALTTPVFRLLTRLTSWIWNESSNLDMQPTEPGNASDKLPTDQVEVTVLGAQEPLSLRGIAPNPFTPNGDNINDVVVFDFDVFLLTAETDISVSILTLAGKPVKKLELAGVAGEQRIEWNGEDESEERVPPGVYLYRLFVDSDSEETKEQIGTIAVTY